MNGYGYEHKSWGTYYSTIFYFMPLEVSVAECSHTMSKVVVISARWETKDLKSLKLWKIILCYELFNKNISLNFDFVLFKIIISTVDVFLTEADEEDEG